MKMILSIRPLRHFFAPNVACSLANVLKVQVTWYAVYFVWRRRQVDPKTSSQPGRSRNQILTTQSMLPRHATTQVVRKCWTAKHSDVLAHASASSTSSPCHMGACIHLPNPRHSPALTLTAARNRLLVFSSQTESISVCIAPGYKSSIY